MKAKKASPDMIVAELGVLRPVEEDGPGRSVDGLCLGCGP